MLTHEFLTKYHKTIVKNMKTSKSHFNYRWHIAYNVLAEQSAYQRNGLILKYKYIQ